jgi:hypothetical protein
VVPVEVLPAFLQLGLLVQFYRREWTELGFGLLTATAVCGSCQYCDYVNGLSPKTG